MAVCAVSTMAGYDRHGQLLETALRSARLNLCEKFATRLSCREHAGIFRLLGPGEPPLFPNYEPFVAPAGHVLVTKIFH